MLTINISDSGNVGEGGALHGVGYMHVTVLPLNDPPDIIIDAQDPGLLAHGGALGLDEDGTLSLALLSVDDKEVASGNGKLTLSLQCQHGEIGFSADEDVGFSADEDEDNVATARDVAWDVGGFAQPAEEGPWPAVEFSGGIVEVNRVLSVLEYVPRRDWHGVDDLTVSAKKKATYDLSMLAFDVTIEIP